MGKRVAILQSNYIPWKGYFDLIRSVDEFVLYDDVQYTKGDWRNRNKVKTQSGTQWLTVPVRITGRFSQPIREAAIGDPAWADNHATRLRYSYNKAPHYPALKSRVDGWYRAAAALPLLTEVNELFIRGVCELLGITTRITRSGQYPLGNPDPTGRLVDICAAAGADTYLSGPAAKAYLDESRFAAAGIRVEYMDYTGYPEYPQVHPPFDHAVTVLDLLFHTGPQAADYLTRVRHAA